MPYIIIKMTFFCFPVFLRSESSRLRPASTGRRPDLSVQAHPGMHRASNHPSADAHVEEEGLRVAAPTHLPSGDQTSSALFFVSS